MLCQSVNLCSRKHPVSSLIQTVATTDRYTMVLLAHTHEWEGELIARMRYKARTQRLVIDKVWI